MPKRKVMTNRSEADMLETVAEYLNDTEPFDFMDEGTEKTLTVSARASRTGFRMLLRKEGAGEEDSCVLSFKLVLIKRRKCR